MSKYTSEQLIVAMKEDYSDYSMFKFSDPKTGAAKKGTSDFYNDEYNNTAKEDKDTDMLFKQDQKDSKKKPMDYENSNYPEDNFEKPKNAFKKKILNAIEDDYVDTKFTEDDDAEENRKKAKADSIEEFGDEIVKNDDEPIGKGKTQKMADFKKAKIKETDLINLDFKI